MDVAERSQVLTLSAISRYMVLHGEHTPAVIPDEQMERFKFMLDYSDEAVEMCAAPLVPGELIRVVKGPLKGLEGELVEVDGKAKVVVRLDLLGCAGLICRWVCGEDEIRMVDARKCGGETNHHPNSQRYLW